MLGLMLCSCHLEIPDNLFTSRPKFSLCAGPTEYVAGPAGQISWVVVFKECLNTLFFRGNSKRFVGSRCSFRTL